jgi:hypothetical protein
MYHNRLDEYANWPMVLATEQVAEGLRGILGVARADPSIDARDVADELGTMLARAGYNPLPDVTVRRDVEDWVVGVWRDDSPELIESLSSLILTCGMTRGMALLERTANSPNERARAVAQEALDEASKDRLTGWTTDT